MKRIKYYIAKLIKRFHIPAIKASKIHKTARVCSNSQINKTQIGKYSYIGNNCFTNHVIIGSFCSIADNCFIGGAAHPIDFVSTSPVFCKGANIMGKNFSHKQFNVISETEIGNDVWLGANVTVLAGRKIGNGAVVGSGSVVTKDIGNYEIWAGNPARFIKRRFSEEIENELISLQWWEWDDEKIARFADCMDNPEEFINAVKKEETR